jgi:ABC-2 type transport system ATP-binding protein
MVAMMIKPSGGSILLDRQDISKEHEKFKRFIGYMPQRFGLYADLTVGENLDFFMDIYGIRGSERVRRRERYLGFSNLLPFIHREAGNLSGGMKQKLGLACVLVHQPELLILDEPTNGVDPISRMEFWDILAAMRSKGMTIIVSTAYMDEGEKCDQLLLMHKARRLAMVTPGEMLRGFSDLEEALIHHIQEFDHGLSEDNFVV